MRLGLQGSWSELNSRKQPRDTDRKILDSSEAREVGERH